MHGAEKRRGVVFKGMAGVLAAVMMSCGMSDVALASDIQTDMPSHGQVEGMAYPQALNTEALRRLLDHYESIPDIVLEQGDVALQAWKEAHPQEGRAGFWGCAAAVAGVIATTAFPAAKILKIKKLIKALGGVRSAIKIMAGASFNYEKLKALGGAAAALAAELTGIGSVKSQCFA
ncbi:hypothetical protein CGZ88_0434 [Bifidobacterium anseris]|uniref:Uncharacterized protein n=1 Tax=Bifidobacterium anseris TaxID=2020963 RepID=A0A2N5J233_9BIFI|nr:hypothetical protein [Bifidobacterium anseris]PLS28272.1 hypothetical protein CGZ88_0434 [Bifidobacterium anseris]